ncbi:hypothetical protein K2X14_12215 [Acetobacter sp. TBRC 12305]|uniref:Cysteine-rich CWC n=1 Tax=Acetobacter garciniae TaxID=2817435 RepID=A0A939KRP4_9PROT|nr:hypothetical protein [Acetobacter garciniae]MBO1325706.1 hypothetical protein [Acetobacter garciniae]MBX0345606.1 hypothetical protein [Acetobacter garciniae]
MTGHDDGATLCTACGTPTACTASATCWCMAVPHEVPVPTGGLSGCLCPHCLEKHIRNHKDLGRDSAE